MSKRKHYDNDFKIHAVKLALEIGQSKACNELNLPENTIYGWMHAYRQGKLDLGPGTQTPARALTMNEELIELRKQVKELTKENKRLKDENEFLEEASAFFAAIRRKEELFYGRIRTEDYTVDELKQMVWRYFMSYWNNRRICTANGGLPPMVKRIYYYASIEAAA